MKTFKWSEVLEFVNAQPNERPVFMGSPSPNEENCGCLMVQFAAYKGFDDYTCVTWEGTMFFKYDERYQVTAEIEDAPEELIRKGICAYLADGHFNGDYSKPINNFGVIKQRLRNRGFDV